MSDQLLPVDVNDELPSKGNGECCENCYFVLRGEISADLKVPLYCRESPPTVIGFAVQVPVHGVGTRIQGAFPPVAPDTWCGRYVPDALEHEETDKH